MRREPIRAKFGRWRQQQQLGSRVNSPRVSALPAIVDFISHVGSIFMMGRRRSRSDMMMKTNPSIITANITTLAGWFKPRNPTTVYL